MLAGPARQGLGCGALPKRHRAKCRLGSQGARGCQPCGSGILRERHGWRYFPLCLGLEGPLPLRFRGADESEEERVADTLFLRFLIDLYADLRGAGCLLSVGIDVAHRRPIGREDHPIDLNYRRASQDTWWVSAHIIPVAACRARIAETWNGLPSKAMNACPYQQASSDLR